MLTFTQNPLPAGPPVFFIRMCPLQWVCPVKGRSCEPISVVNIQSANRNGQSVLSEGGGAYSAAGIGLEQQRDEGVSAGGQAAPTVTGS